MAVKSTVPIVPENDCTDNLQRHGSIRKVLHSLVGNDSLLGISAKMLDRPKQQKIEDNLSHYQVYFREYALISEFNILCNHFIPGLYTIPSANSRLVWFGVLFVRSGLYRGGIFRFILQISENFPDSGSPTVIFESKVFHPCISEETQELNVQNVFTNWSKNSNHLWQVLEYMSSIFYNISTQNAVNPIAAQIYERDKKQYEAIVQKCVEQSQNNLFTRVNNEDAHYIRFQNFDQNVHSETLKALKSPQTRKKGVSKNGFTFVKKDSLKPCSCEPYK